MGAGQGLKEANGSLYHGDLVSYILQRIVFLAYHRYPTCTYAAGVL